MDFNTQQQLAQKVATPEEKPKDVFDLIVQGLDKFAGNVLKFANINGGSALSTGIFANFGIEKAGIGVNNMINKAADSMSIKGGVVTNGLIDGLQVASARDFSKVTQPPIEASSGGASFSDLAGAAGSHGSYDWSPASRGDLGNLPPPSVGGQSGGREIG